MWTYLCCCTSKWTFLSSLEINPEFYIKNFTNFITLYALILGRDFFLIFRFKSTLIHKMTPLSLSLDICQQQILFALLFTYHNMTSLPPSLTCWPRLCNLSSELFQQSPNSSPSFSICFVTVYLSFYSILKQPHVVVKVGIISLFSQKKPHTQRWEHVLG